MSSLKLISATDTQYSAALLKALNEQRNLGIFCDVTIIVQDKKFRAHKTILSASSTYFHQLFTVAGQVIELNFIKAEIFEKILNYIYSSKIIRIRSDMVEELINAGQILGVKFIANLGAPLSQVKGLPGLSKDTGNKTDTSTEAMPIITESFSISAEEFNQTNASAGNDEDSDSDVLFVSKTDAPPKDQKSKSSEVIEPDAAGSNDTAPKQNQENHVVQEKAPGPEKAASEKSPSITCPPTSLPDTNPLCRPDTNPLCKPDTNPLCKPDTNPLCRPDTNPLCRPDTNPLCRPDTNPLCRPDTNPLCRPDTTPLCRPDTTPLCRPDTTPLCRPDTTPLCSSGTNPLCSSGTTSINSSSPARVSSGSASTTPARSSSFTPEPSNVPQPCENTDIMGVHKKQISATVRQGDFKLRLLDVSSESPANRTSISKLAVATKKTVTLDRATEIDSISSGCKVYANIGEDTYDIVPVKEDPGEGGSKVSKGKRALMATPMKTFDKSPVAPKSGPNKKKPKTELEDHYELVMDGKTFYVCVVCKRPYVCLTSLRRHFNTHSWEKKYPCRYCNKVFALAEYRTKHEIHHTGERRYQCLLCNEMFINYQLLSTHCKQVHNQDPSGRKEKDDADNNLYRLLPCKTVQMKPYSWISEEAGVPVISEDGSVQHITNVSEDIHCSTQSRMLNWDDIFVEPDAHMRRNPHAPSMDSTPAGGSEFDFVIPETY